VEPRKTNQFSPKLISLLGNFAEFGPVAAEIGRQAGIKIVIPRERSSEKVDLKFEKLPFWEALEKLAQATHCRLSLQDQGKQLALLPLEPGRTAPPVQIAGPFRLEMKQIVGKHDFESGSTYYDVLLELTWEPWLPVYFLDADPLAEARGAVPVPPARIKSASTGTSHPLVVRLQGIPRSATEIEELKLKLNVIAADKLQMITFSDLTSDKPSQKELAGISYVLQPVTRVGKRVDFRIEMEYPADHPILESFQQFSVSNRFQLVHPDQRTITMPSDYNTLESGRRIKATYTFLAPGNATAPLPDLKGWSIQYQSPTPLRETSLTWSFTHIKLP
jgi:hypothetical protein